MALCECSSRVYYDGEERRIEFSMCQECLDELPQRHNLTNKNWVDYSLNNYHDLSVESVGNFTKTRHSPIKVNNGAITIDDEWINHISHADKPPEPLK